MPNTLGPGAFGAARAVTSRPSVTPDNTGPDSWFKDCSSPAARDGTELRAAFLNAMIAQFREIRRANGRPEDNADSMAMRAIRSQRANFVAAAGVAGTANAVTLTFDPPFASIADLLATPIRFLVEQNSTAAVTISVDGLAAQSLVFLDGTAIGNGGLVTGRLVEIMHDGTRFVAIAGVAAASGHTHPMTDIVGLIAALDGKVTKTGDSMSGTLRLSFNNPEIRIGETGGAWRLIKQGNVGATGLLVLQHSTDDFGTSPTNILSVNPNTGLLSLSTGVVLGSSVSASGSIGAADRVLSGGSSPSWRAVGDLTPVLDYQLRYASNQAGTNPGYTNGQWNTIALNTLVSNEIPAANVAAGVINLPAGSYTAKYFTSVSAGTAADLRVRDLTGNTTLGLTVASQGAGAPVAGFTYFTLASNRAIALQIWPGATQSHGNLVVSDEPDLHCGILLQKVK
jgi:hypothetical protein